MGVFFLNTVYFLSSHLLDTSMCCKTINTPLVDSAHREGGREGRGESFPGPRDVWGARHRSKMLKRMAFFWPEICTKSFYNAPQIPSRMVRGHPPTIPPTFWSRHIWNEVVIGPRDNGFPGPVVAPDGPECTRVVSVFYSSSCSYSLDRDGQAELIWVAGYILRLYTDRPAQKWLPSRLSVSVLMYWDELTMFFNHQLTLRY